MFTTPGDMLSIMSGRESEAQWQEVEIGDSAWIGCTDMLINGEAITTGRDRKRNFNVFLIFLIFFIYEVLNWLAAADKDFRVSQWFSTETHAGKTKQDVQFKKCKFTSLLDASR